MKDNKTRKIIVAGAGHGGIIAGSLLAQHGYDVTIYEKEKETALGYPWDDDINESIIKEVGLPPLEPKEYTRKKKVGFASPNRRYHIQTNLPDHLREIAVDRRLLYRKLFDYARKSNVSIEFECRITGPLIKNGTIAGIQTEKGNSEGDLVIDACGLHSPIRKKLPESYSILKEFGKGEIFYTYRAYFNFFNDKGFDENKYLVYFGFQGLRGIAWYRLEHGQSDVLFGGIEPLSLEKVDIFMQKMREIQPSCGSELKAGGFLTQIPVRRPLERFVGENYAAVGDSAAMTMPLMGSGIEYAMDAGKILAETVIKHDQNREEHGYTTTQLWDYQYEYYLKYGAQAFATEYLKMYLMTTPWEDVNFVFEKGLISAKEMEASMLRQNVVIPFIDLLGRAMRSFSRLGVLINLKSAADSMKTLKSLALRIPKQYDPQKIAAWSEQIQTKFRPFLDILNRPDFK